MISFTSGTSITLAHYAMLTGSSQHGFGYFYTNSALNPTKVSVWHELNPGFKLAQATVPLVAPPCSPDTPWRVLSHCVPSALPSVPFMEAAPPRPDRGTRTRRLRSLGTFAEPAPEPEAKELAPPEPGPTSEKTSIITVYHYMTPPVPRSASLKVGNERRGSAAASQHEA